MVHLSEIVGSNFVSSNSECDRDSHDPCFYLSSTCLADLVYVPLTVKVKT